MPSQTTSLWFKVFYCFFSLENNTKSCNKSYVLLWVNWNQPRGTVKCFYGSSLSREETPPGQAGHFRKRAFSVKRDWRGEERSGTVLLNVARSPNRGIPLCGNNPCGSFGFSFPWVISGVGENRNSDSAEYTRGFFLFVFCFYLQPSGHINIT